MKNSPYDDSLVFLLSLKGEHITHAEPFSKLPAAYRTRLAFKQEIVWHIHKQPSPAGNQAHQGQYEPVDMLPWLHLLVAVLTELHGHPPYLSAGTRCHYL